MCIRDRSDALKAINEISKLTGLPTTDPVRFSADVLFEAIRPLLAPATLAIK